MKKNETGFSLVELIMAVGVVGILTAIAIPNYKAMEDRQKYTQVRAFFAQAMVGEQLIHNNGLTLYAQLQLVHPGNAGCTMCNQGFAAGTDPLAAGNVAWGDACWKALGFLDGNPKDPWGRYYMLDENEGEWGTTDNRYDSIFSAGADMIFNGTVDGEQVYGDDSLLRMPTLNTYSPAYVDTNPGAVPGLQ